MVDAEFFWYLRIDFLLFSRRCRKGRVTGYQKEQEDDIEDRRKLGIELLNTLCFHVMSSKDSKFQRICKALVVHQRLFGDMDVPRYFVVPQSNDDIDKGDKWPTECLGMKLGLRVRDIRANLTYTELKYRQTLMDIGFF